MNAFVTGASGFVGRELVRALAARGERVVALARSERAEASARAAGATSIARGELDDEASLRAGMQGADTVFHAAALVADWGAPADFQRVNVDGTARVLAAARASGVRRLVHVSTEAVLLGGAPLVRVDERRAKPARPLGLYARSKAQSEELVLAAADGELATLVIRPRLVWGAGDTSLLPQMVDAVRAGRFLWIAGGAAPTSTCHVRNVAQGALLAAERGLSGQIYFLTDGEPVQSRAFLTALLATQGVAAPRKSMPRVLALALALSAELAWRVLPLRGAPPITRSVVRLFGEEVTVSDRKARDELGYRPLVSMAQGLAEMRSAADGVGAPTAAG